MTSMPPVPTLVDSADAVRQGRVSPLELAEQSLQAAERAAELNAMAVLDADRALEVARERTREAERGELRGPLHGVPLTVKELFSVQGIEVRAGTRAALPPVGHWSGSADALAVARLRKAGAVVLGTTNMVEIALGIHSENAWTGPVRNPHDPGRHAGGSSSGSAVAVATGVGLASLGTDTGGSIRIPAGLCGIVGVKPTWGVIPVHGGLPLSPTCDHAGPLARTVADAATLVDVLASPEPLAPPASMPRPDAPHRVGVPWPYLDGAVSDDVRRSFDGLLARLNEQGTQVVDVEVDHLDEALDAYLPLVRAEAAHVHRDALAAGAEGFSEGITKALEVGAALSAVEYLECRRLRGQVLVGLSRVFHDVEALLLPATPLPATPLGTETVDVGSGPEPHRTAFLRLTAPFSFVGVPVVTLPYDEIGGLPLGVQVVGPRGGDDRLLSVSAWVEQVVAG